MQSTITTVAGDAVHYFLYPSTNDKSSVTTLGTCIDEYVSTIIPRDFLWHRDPWNIHLARDEDADQPDAYLLEGYMRIGDSIDDEWALVWLLKSISIKWPELSISVFDQDGSFLLIEAADHLPSWVTPANSDNRVFIRNGQLHLIPLSRCSPSSTRPKKRLLPGKEDHSWLNTAEEEIEGWISIPDALNALKDPTFDTRAPHLVEKLAWARVDRYPAAFKDHIHHARVYLPLDIAKALSVRPELVQRAAEAFYARDTAQLRSAHRMARFPPSTVVLASIRITRLAYAQLLGQKFFPPKVFGRWEGDAAREGTVEWKHRDVGMKIAVGFEMLFQDTKNQSSSLTQIPEAVASSSAASLDALRRTPHYQDYINVLSQHTDFFRGSLQGSQLWQEREEKAASTYLNITKNLVTSTNFASEVDSAIQRCPADIPVLQDGAEDPDNWLNVAPSDLNFTTTGEDAAMEVDESITNVQAHRQRMEDLELKKEADKLQDFASQVGSFVEGQGDLQGALVENDADSDNEDVSDFSESSDSDSEVDSNKATDQRARQEALDNLIAPLAQGEYGKMPPSYYETSQKVAEPADDPSGAAESDMQVDDTTEKPDQDDEGRYEKLRRPIFVRNSYDGVDSDDESSVGSEHYGIDPLNRDDSDVDTDEDRPQVEENEELEVDMNDEVEEFINFSKQALGISEEHWASILDDRKSRGAYVPASAKQKTSPVAPSSGAQKTVAPGSTSSPPVADTKPRPLGSRPGANPHLDSFEAVMQAMDTELERIRGPSSKGASSSRDKGKGKAPSPQDEEDLEAEMDEELRRILDKGDVADGIELGSDTSINYNLIKNFLESYTAEGGESGPVGGLAAMLQPGFGQQRWNQQT